MPTTVQTVVKHQDLTDEQITLIKKRIEVGAKAEEYFDKFCEHEPWEEGSKTMSYRRLILPKVKPEDVVPAREGVAPRPTKIAYATFQVSVSDYREKVKYTDESKRYNYDDVVRDSGTTLSYKFTQKLDYIKGRPFISSKATITPESTITATMRKAKLILGPSKNKAKHWVGGSYLMMTTPEVIEKFQDELEAKGSSLDEGTKEELAAGILYKKKGFVISECPSDLFQKNSNTHYIVFIGRTFEGKSPVTCRKMGDVEVINNPLGSSVLLDEDGNITSDDNRQEGSVAMNALGLGAAINDDMCILVCEFPINTVAGTDLAMSDRTGYVSSSGTSKFLVNAVAATDGDTIASPTITVKENDASGKAVTAKDGAYTVTAGKRYYYSVAKSGYTTVTGYFNATADDLNLTVALSASA